MPSVNRSLRKMAATSFIRPVLGLLLILAAAIFSPPGCPAEDQVVTDIFGTRIDPRKTFSRIISLYPAHTENIAALDCTDLLIGISPGDDFPAIVTTKQRFSYRDNPEKFIAARPDLVLVRPMIVGAYMPLLEKLHGAGITVVSLQPRSVDEIYSYWSALGVLLNRRSEARRMVELFHAELQRLEEKVSLIPVEKRPRVYFQSIHKKMKTFSPRSIAIFCLESAGGRNIASDATARRQSNIAAYSKERILAHADRTDIFIAQQGRMNPVTLEMLKQEPGFAAIKAVRQNRVHLIDEKLVSRPTLRLLIGMHRLHAMLYPQP
ncbi:MAG: ABC transporter substrate-binding protein [Thermodesulfobacteriota bacterium]